MPKSSDHLTLAFAEVIEESRKEFEKNVRPLINEIMKTVEKQYRELSKRIEKIEEKLGAAPKSEQKRPGRRPSQRACSVDGCTRPHYAKGLCSSHYQKMRKEVGK